MTVIWRSILMALTAATFLSGSGAWAQGDVPRVGDWAREAAGVTGAFPHRLVFLSKMPDKDLRSLALLDFDVAEFNGLGYFQAVDSRSIGWDLKLNAARLAKRDAVEALLELTGADTVVVAPDSGSWRLMRKGEGGALTPLAEFRAPKARTAKGIAAWLPAALGWDGVVIAQKDGFVLVGSTVAILSTPDIQALAVSDSAAKFSLKPAERQGAGLLGLAEGKAGVGVFDIVLLGQGVTTIPVGTKLIIEKKKKK